MKTNIIYNECCLTGMSKICENSIDLICTDLPYGALYGDSFDLQKMWLHYERILKPFGTIILFGKQPFSSKLVLSNLKMFKYALVWQKSIPGGFAQAPYKILCEHEDILIFSNAKCSKNAKHRMIFNPQNTKSCYFTRIGKNGNSLHRKGRKTQKDYIQKTTNYPRSILKFNNQGRVKHPTQKPVKLIEYLIKTFSNENDLLLDNCIGSGTTAIACIRNNRNYIGFEIDNIYFKICNERILNEKTATI